MVFQSKTNLIQSPRILAEAMKGSSGRFHLLLEIGWQFDLQAVVHGTNPRAWLKEVMQRIGEGIDFAAAVVE